MALWEVNQNDYYRLRAVYKALSCIAPTSSVAFFKDVFTLFVFYSLPDQRDV